MSTNGHPLSLVSAGKPLTQRTEQYEVIASPYMAQSQQPYFAEEETAIFSKYTPPVACKP